MPARGRNPAPAIAGRRGLAENAALKRPPVAVLANSRKGLSTRRARSAPSSPLRVNREFGVGGDKLRQKREAQRLPAIQSQVIVEIAEDGPERFDLDSVGAGAFRQPFQSVPCGPSASVAI